MHKLSMIPPHPPPPPPPIPNVNTAHTSAVVCHHHTRPLQAGSGWGILSSPFAALRGAGGSSSGSIRGRGSGSSARRAQRPPPGSRPAATASLQQRGTTTPPVEAQMGWTATMAEPLLDLCFDVFFKYGATTLPLLPEVLALHQVRKEGGRGVGDWES